MGAIGLHSGETRKCGWSGSWRRFWTEFAEATNAGKGAQPSCYGLSLTRTAMDRVEFHRFSCLSESAAPVVGVDRPCGVFGSAGVVN